MLLRSDVSNVILMALFPWRFPPVNLRLSVVIVIHLVLYDTPFELSDEALAHCLSRYGSVLGSSRFNPQGYEGIQNGIRVVRMQLSESVHPSYASPGESNTRERFLPEGSGIFPIMSQKCAPTLVCFNCNQLGHTFSDCKEETKCSVCKEDGHYAIDCNLS